jgi:hypothetical protein
MECQTCSEAFSNDDTLREHVGFFQVCTVQASRLTDPDSTQSRAQYLVQELLKCLAHASPHCEKDGARDVEDDNDDDNDSDNYQDNSNEEEVDDAKDGSLQCPLCDQKRSEGFDTWKDLKRHFATRIVTYFFISIRTRTKNTRDTDVSCQEYCSSCERIFNRASPYLHHKCRRGKNSQKSQGNLSNAVLQRRSVIRRKVKKELGIARKSRRLPDESPVPRHKRRKTEAGDVTVDIQTDLSGQSVELTVAGTFLNGLQPESKATTISLLPNIGEQVASASANAFSDGLTTTPMDSAFEISHGAPASFSEAPLFDAQTTCRFPYSRTEYGSKAPAMYSDPVFGSKAPAMYLDPVFGSQMPASYSDAVLGSKAPAMYLGSVFGSQTPASYSDAVLGSKAPVMYSDAGFRSVSHFHESSGSRHWRQ